MIKFILSLTKFLLAVLLSILFVSCQFEMKGITGSGNVVTQNRDTGAGFEKVTASNGLDVVIKQSDSLSITVEADDNLLPHIITEIENGILHVRCDYNSFINISSKKITVKMPVISSLESSSGASLASAGTLVSDDLQLRSNSGSDLKVGVEADKLLSESSSGSTLHVAGKALSYDASSSSGSDTQSEGLMANEITAQASSGSHISVHPIVKLVGKASSGASVNYVNTPKVLEKTESSGGSVSN